MADPVYQAFLVAARQEVAAAVAASDILCLEPRPSFDGPPHTYDGRLTGIEHLRCAPDGTVVVSAEPIEFTLQFPADYCRSTNATLQFRVALVTSPLFHPNVRGIVCLGGHFRPGTRARAVIEQVYRIVSGRVRATDHGYDAAACRYYVAHPEQVAALRAAPLWRRTWSGALRGSAVGHAAGGVER